MGQVNVRVNGYNHTIGCKDGEEEHVSDLVAQLEEKVRVIRSMGGQFSEARMLLHVALLFADEAADLRIDLARLRSQGASAAAAGPGMAQGVPGAGLLPVPPEPDPRLAERLARIAERIENITGAIEKP
ncbi:cell division protein ZapA [Roseococcus sp. SYP-B2431]|uniref:cell division protein ZapA n=1 Tax=Roseococcus sp. SYP-B2431 TaxID=2496640 RepID=UPI001039E07B|nr:cell division protein ZapA [Roseococcus sp. SYP-B2431]TCH99762.1 cell division protein ZapA [Roseococcus sp. SYP-B2431]